MPSEIDEILGNVAVGEPETKTVADLTPEIIRDAAPDNDAEILEADKKQRREKGELPVGETTTTDEEAVETPADTGPRADSGLKLDDQLVDYAVRLGLPLSAARAFPSTQALEQELYMRAQRQYGPAQQPQQAQQPKPDDDDFDIEKALGNDLDPTLRDTLVKAFNTQKQKQSALNDRLANTEQAIEAQRIDRQRQQMLTAAVEFDDFIASLPDVYREAGIFGKGRERDLQRGSTEYNQRAEAFAMAMDMENAMLMRGARNVDRRQLMERAAWAIVGPKIHEATKRRNTEKLSRAEKTYTNPPTSRQSATMKNDLRSTLDGMMRGWGKDPRTGDDL